jgi:hypothetical protein
MTAHRPSPTAVHIQELAEQYHVTYKATPTDRLARHITRLAGDDVHLDAIEQMLIALQRAGRITRMQMVQLQAKYLREIRS